jgi:hypothetical protein
MLNQKTYDVRQRTPGANKPARLREWPGFLFDNPPVSLATVTLLSVSLVLAIVGVVLLLWARSVLLIVNKSMRRRGYSNLIITDVTVALPMAFGIVAMIGMMSWVFQ